MDGLDSIKAWAMGAVITPLMGLLLWYFKRSTSQTDDRIKDMDDAVEEIRRDLAKKADRADLSALWERMRAQDEDIRNLGAVWSTELRSHIESIRREQNDHHRQTNERLDKILTLMATSTMRGRNEG